MLASVGHVRRRFYEIAVIGPAPIDGEALTRIAELYRIEDRSAGRRRTLHPALRKRAVRRRQSRNMAWPGTRPDEAEDKARRGDPLHALALASNDRFLDDAASRSTARSGVAASCRGSRRGVGIASRKGSTTEG